MNLGRVFRTTRHLTVEQWLYRFVCRGKFASMEKLPTRAAAHFAKAAAKVPAPDPAAPALAAVAAHVRQLQRAVHGQFAAEVPLGRFTFLGRTIDFGGVNAVEWRRELGEKNNPLWRMNLSYFGYLVPLFDHDARAALPVARLLLQSMTAQNPWSSPGIFRDVWHPYSVSHRVINLAVCLSILNEQAPDLLPHAAPLVEEVRLGTAFILGNLERDLQYNHLLKNYVMLSVVAAAVPGFAACVLLGTEASIAQQFLADGGQAERAPMYHILSLLDLRILRDSGAFAGEAQALITRTAAASEAAVAAMVHPDGEVALFNDSWLGEGPAAATVVADLPLAPPTPTRWLLPDAGYVRLAAGDDSVVMDFGPCGPDDNPGHAHADFLSLELSLAGRRVVVDTGTPTYTQGALRDELRSAASHNGPIRRGLEPIEFWGSFRVGHRGYAHILPMAEELRFAAWHDGYLKHGTAVARAIELVPGKGLLIADAWVGAPPETAETHFLVPGEWSITGTHATSGDASVRFEALDGRLSAFGPAQHWLRFGERRDAHRTTLTPFATTGIQATLLWIAHDGAAPPADADGLRAALVALFLAVPAVKRLV
jgi:hypothetical protein